MLIMLYTCQYFYYVSVHFGILGEQEKLKRLLQELNERQNLNLAGPTAVEELLFQQVLDARRDNLIIMRKPENYSKRGDKKG